MIKINGKDSLEMQGKSITQMLSALEYDPLHVAVEYNLKMLDKDDYDKTMISDGDEIEIVTFMGGGK